MIKDLIQQIERIRDGLVEIARHHAVVAGNPHPNYAESQRNLLHYMALRSHDLRPLQHELSVLGLSSLGRVESHVIASVDAVLSALHSLDGQFACREEPELHSNFEVGNRLLETHSRDLLGLSPSRRTVRIMVTLPSEAETDYTLIHSLVQQGMDVARINCAHDGPAVWERMIRHIRRAEKALGRTCRILMDLGGPKLRTGPVEPGPAVVKLRPERDSFGKVIRPARIWITAANKPISAPTEAAVSLPVSAVWMSKLRQNDQIRFTDARGAHRAMTVVDTPAGGCWAEMDRTAYVTPGISLTRWNSKKDEGETNIGKFQAPLGAIDLAIGDLLILTRQLRSGRGATRDSAGRVLSPAHIGCTLPEVFNDVQTGESVWLDDGKIGGFIEKVETERIFVRITGVRPANWRVSLTS
jgi:pyruvate kinase